ncbi:MAG: hypothetical protein JNL82_04640 [Myxococcales bacterium]|nr:hypothetical protein [Myxococcales bacterium]
MNSGSTAIRRVRVRPARVAASSLVALCLACNPGAATTSAPEPPPAPKPDEVALARGNPISLVASDGTAVNLRSVAVRSSIDEPLAFTELELVFDNPEGRQLDGRLSVALPADARLTRFARAAGPGAPWVESEVVPRRTAYAALKSTVGAEEPALAVRGGNLVARVDAIAAREPTRLVLAYVQELRGRGDPYRIPLAGLPTLREFTVRVNSRTPINLGGDPQVQKSTGLGTPYGPEVRFTNYRPTRDLTVNFSGPRELGLRRDAMVVARLAPVPHDHPAPLDSLTVLFDTSASQALGFEAQVDRLRDVLAALDRRLAADIPLRVLAFDQTVETVFEGRLGAFGPAELAALRSRGAFGASNLSSALRVAASHGEARYQRLLIMTDGAVTAGPATNATLRGEAARLLDAGVVRIDVLGFGGHGDGGLLRDLTAAAPNHRGLVLGGDLSSDAVALKLSRGVVHDVTVAVEGSAWVYPEKIDALQAGDDVLIYAGLEQDSPRWDRFAVHLSGGEHLGRDFPVPLVETRSPLLADAWSGARASWLIDQARRHCVGDDRSLCDQWRQRALDWSVTKRVINDITAMVVLPSHAADLARFASRSPGAVVSLDPADLPAFLAVGNDGLEWAPREPLDPAAPRFGSAEAYPLRFDLSPGPWWDAPAAPKPTAVRQPEPPRSLVRRPPRRPSRPVPEDRSVDGPTPVPDAELPDKDAGAALHGSPGPHRTPEDAYEGNFLTVMNLLSTWNAKGQALDVARRWHRAEPGDVMALVALGQALEAHGRGDQAARAYGSIIDLYPGRADMRRLAAARLERLGEPHQWLAIDAYGRAIEQRSDDPAGYRLYAYALLRANYYREAFEALVDGLAWARSDPRTRPLEKVLTGDLGLVAAAWIRRWPDQEAYVREALKIHEIELPTEPSLRFVLSWDNELADLDLHVRDGLGWHAFYRHKALDSGGSLSDDMDAGYGLEAFIIDGSAGAFPYRVEVGYYARGASHGGGKLEVIEHDGNGQLFFDQRPFVVLKQRAYVDLGSVAAAPSQTPPAR